MCFTLYYKQTAYDLNTIQDYWDICSFFLALSISLLEKIKNHSTNHIGQQCQFLAYEGSGSQIGSCLCNKHVVHLTSMTIFTKYHIYIGFFIMFRVLHYLLKSQINEFIRYFKPNLVRANEETFSCCVEISVKFQNLYQ